ncbi:MAG: hypothetical protein KY410_05445 [Proteobacteria bacterium]|nr:hypothetical protein [Pseudomonadota bacterium]
MTAGDHFLFDEDFFLPGAFFLPEDFFPAFFLRAVFFLPDDFFPDGVFFFPAVFFFVGAAFFFLDEVFFFACFFLAGAFFRFFFAALPFAESFGGGGTLAPSRRASERPMAIACLRLFTFLWEPPLRSLPSLRSCMTFSTFSDAFSSYLAIGFSRNQ